MTSQDLTVYVLLLTFGTALIKVMIVTFNALRDRKLTKAEKGEISSAFSDLVDTLRQDTPPRGQDAKTQDHQPQ